MNIKTTLTCLLFFLITLTSFAGSPNIIMIMVDDFGYETLGCNGSADYKTPVLDNMAQNGIRFEHCYAQPLCTPTRVKLMTGIYNVRNYVEFALLDRKQQTFGHIMKKNGYKTCVAGKWQLGTEPESAQHFGFDESCLWHHINSGRDKKGDDGRYAKPMLAYNGVAKEYTGTEYGPDLTSDFICKFMTENKSEPFFVYYPMILTHCPFVATPDSPDWKEQCKRSPSYKGDARYFGDMVAYVDKTVGKLKAKLEELGIADNTVILFTGDNGTDKPVVTKMKDGTTIAGNKGSMKDGGTHVPLIAYSPALIQKGVVTDALVDFSDFLPTICDLTGVAKPENVDGRSFYPLLTGKPYKPRDWIYIWYSRSGFIDQAQEFTRNQRYKLYRTGDFFDIEKDLLEKNPIGEEKLLEKTRSVKIMLQAALDQYTDARPENLRKVTPAGKKKKANKKN